MRKYASAYDDFWNTSVGFDRLFDTLQKNASKAMDNFPPYNIKKIDENKFVIEMAVAGFGKSDIEIDMEGNTLNISGAVEADTEEDVEYYHKGIAERNFKRRFTLADRVEVKDAELINGVLKVYLNAAEAMQKQLVHIRDNSKNSK